MKLIFSTIIIAFIFMSCDKKQEAAEEIIKQSILFHGGEAYDTLDVQFNFRDRLYGIHLKNGLYKYTRATEDSLGHTTTDILTNTGFKREVADSLVTLSKKDSTAYANSVNSVAYFALLPKGLLQEAVQMELLADQVFEGKTFNVVRIFFTQENGGKDYDDEFYYWFDKADYSMDYFAYKYHTDGGGVRFRKALNARVVEGVLFQDYENYEVSLNTPMEELLQLYLANELKLLSKIVLEFND